MLVTPLFDEEGELAWFLGSQVELGANSPAHSMPGDRGPCRWSRRFRTRRRQVLELMSRGLLNKQIAWELKISEKTVKMHRALLLEQLGVPPPPMPSALRSRPGSRCGPKAVWRPRGPQT